MKTTLTTIAIAALVLLAATSAAAQSASAPKYDPATESVITGKVVSVHERQCPVSGTLGAHFMLETETGKVYEVHLAPAKFTKEFDMVFRTGDKVEVTGIALVFQGKDAILARQVKHGTETVTFRDKKGNPIWN